VVVNSAGLSVFGTVTSGDPAHWRAVMDVNLDGAYRVLRQAARALRAAGRGGSIVNIASFLGIEVQPGQAAYQASKAGVIQLTRTAARELARHNIRVNAIAPGFFASEMTDGFLATDSGRHMVRQLPQRRAGAPAELDGALLLLASDAGRYMTGSVLTVDGGHGLCMP
jgi:NAD(P)-dependent dehydrogenase (short-subunit alcohol dehydrogenase family)